MQSMDCPLRSQPAKYSASSAPMAPARAQRSRSSRVYKSHTRGSTAVLGLDSQDDNAAMKTRIGVQLQASSYFEYLTLEELLNLFGFLLPEGCLLAGAA